MCLTTTTLSAFTDMTPLYDLHFEMTLTLGWPRPWNLLDSGRWLSQTYIDQITAVEDSCVQQTPIDITVADLTLTLRWSWPWDDLDLEMNLTFGWPGPWVDLDLEIYWTLDADWMKHTLISPITAVEDRLCPIDSYGHYCSRLEIWPSDDLDLQMTLTLTWHWP